MEPSMERAIGRMEGSISALNENVSLLRAEMRAVTHTTRSDYEAIALSVRRVEANVESLNERLSSVEPLVSAVVDDMNEVMPVAKQLSRWRSVGAGVLISITFIGAAFSNVIMAAKERLISFLFG